jgi:hypothetical protein
VATTRWQLGLARRQRADLGDPVGGFDHGGHGLHHGDTTSMVVGPDLSPTRLDPDAAVFFILEN